MGPGSYQLRVDVPKHEGRDYRARIDSRLETDIGPWKESRIPPGRRNREGDKKAQFWNGCVNPIILENRIMGSAQPFQNWAFVQFQNLCFARATFHSIVFCFGEPSIRLRCWRSAHDRYDVFP